MSKTETRIYIVQDAEVRRLVRAGTRAQALRHVAEKTFHVAVASQEEIVWQLTAGNKVEDATTDGQASLPLEPSSTESHLENGDV